MRAGALARRRSQQPPTLSFLSLTSWARPSFTTVRSVPFTTATGLTNALNNAQGGDYIFYNGTSGPLNITAPYNLNNINPSSPVVVDLGVAKSVWGVPTTNNYVSFSYTGTSFVDCFYITNCSNLRFYGGQFSSGQYGEAGIRVKENASNLYFWDNYINVTGGTGLMVQPAVNSTTGSTITNCSFRVEVNRFCMNPAGDTHNDKGTGLHGCLWQDTSVGALTNSTIALYAHDSLRPGESSAGNTWPEGGGGSAIEIGSVGTTFSNNTFYVLGENLLMTPMHTGCVNPGSTSAQTGGNVVNFWGSIPLNGAVFGWVEGNNCTGAVTHAAGGNWYPGNPKITVNHGRHTNTNQYVGAGGNISAPYCTVDPNNGNQLNIQYNDNL